MPIGPAEDDDSADVTFQPLPSSLLPRLNQCSHNRHFNLQRPVPRNTDISDVPAASQSWQKWNRKYVLLCATCGLCSILLGALYLVIYFVLRSYTSSLHYFETVPTYIPAITLVVTGSLILCFVRRKHRISLLIKISGCMCMVCAVLCVVVTVTSTVLHMNRLQTLQECEFFPHSRSCTCTPYTGVLDPTQDVRFVFSLVSSGTNCDVIHGPLYACLRALFGISVIGILVSIFSCMLVYQLVSHEKKKKYWEQMEQRRRRLIESGAPLTTSCSCCDEFGVLPSSELYPWHMWQSTVDERFWPLGRFYSTDDSCTSRSALLSATTPQSQGPLWMPWSGTVGSWGQFGDRMNSTSNGSILMGTESELMESVPEEIENQSDGVLLRPCHTRPPSAVHLRRHTPHHSHGRRPVSDPGVAFQFARFPPPSFRDSYFPPMSYADPRYMWGPPPPYSQPTSLENISGTPRRLPPIPNSPGQANLQALLADRSDSTNTSVHSHNHQSVSAARGASVQSATMNDESRSRLVQSLKLRKYSKKEVTKKEATEGATSTAVHVSPTKRVSRAEIKSLGRISQKKPVAGLALLYPNCDDFDFSKLGQKKKRKSRSKDVTEMLNTYQSYDTDPVAELHNDDIFCSPNPVGEVSPGMLVHSSVEVDDEPNSNDTSELDTMVVHTSSSVHSLPELTDDTNEPYDDVENPSSSATSDSSSPAVADESALFSFSSKAEGSLEVTEFRLNSSAVSNSQRIMIGVMPRSLPDCNVLPPDPPLSYDGRHSFEPLLSNPLTPYDTNANQGVNLHRFVHAKDLS